MKVLMAIAILYGQPEIDISFTLFGLKRGLENIIRSYWIYCDFWNMSFVSKKQSTNCVAHRNLTEGLLERKADMDVSYLDSNVRTVYWLDDVSSLDLNFTTTFLYYYSYGFIDLENSFQGLIRRIQKSSYLPSRHARCPQGSKLPPPISNDRSSCLPLQHTCLLRGYRLRTLMETSSLTVS